MEKESEQVTICRLVANAIGLDEKGLTTPQQIDRHAHRYVTAVRAVQERGIRLADYDGDLTRVYIAIKEICDQTFSQKPREHHTTAVQENKPYFVKTAGLW